MLRVVFSDNSILTEQQMDLRVRAVARSCLATCSALNADEHAVSRLIAGPCRPKMYEILPAATLNALLVAENALISPT